MTANTDVHTCSYYCERPGCIRAQRDELVARLTTPPSAPEPEVHSYDPTDQRESVTIRWPDGKCLSYVLDRTRYTDNLPPSAPVGVEEMQRRLEREESDHLRTIDQRDAAEDALSRMFQAVTGRVAEWSSAWGYTDAIEEVEEHVAALARQPAAGEVDDDGRDAPAQATQAVPQGWPRATKGQRDQGWTLEYRFLERVTDLAASRTEYSTSMEATEEVLIAALEVLATQHQEPTT